MMAAVAKRQLPEPLNEELTNYLVQVAHFLLNTLPDDIAALHDR